MTCAKQLQEAFQSEPKVPVRIGLHAGDAVFKEGNVFGDAVNIASRVESMGIPGAVLLSSNIQNQIRNKPEFKLASLGKFEFKNVEKAMTVYALANKGFPVPKPEEIKGKLKQPTIKRNWLLPAILSLIIVLLAGSWYFQQDNNEIKLGEEKTNFKTPLSKEIREKRVAVMIFENKTNNENLEDFGTMISDWITRGLMETGEATVFSMTNTLFQKGQKGKSTIPSPDLIKKAGVGIVLQGRYYLQENQLIIHANIVDADQGKVIHALEPIQGSKEKMLDLLKELTQEILSYWAIRKDRRLLQNPPKYEAFQLYLDADQYFWSDYQKAKQLYKKAFELDNSFFLPLFSSIFLNQNNANRAGADSIVTLIQQLNIPLTKWEKSLFEEIIAFRKREILKVAQIAEKRYKLDPNSSGDNWNAGTFYFYANYPQKAVELLSGWDGWNYNKEQIEQIGVSLWEGWIAAAYIQLGEYDKALETIDHYFAPKMYVLSAGKHLQALIYLDSLDTFHQQFEIYKQVGVYGNGGEKYSFDQIYLWTCRTLYLIGKHKILKEHALKYIKWSEQQEDAKKFTRNRMEVYSLLGEYDLVITFLEKEILTEISAEQSLWYHTLLGYCYAKKNNPQKAQAQIEKVLSIKDAYTNARVIIYTSNHYFKARIETALGQKEQAVQSFKKAIEENTPFPFRFKEDPFLKPLFGYPPFEELVKPKG